MSKENKTGGKPEKSFFTKSEKPETDADLEENAGVSDKAETPEDGNSELTDLRKKLAEANDMYLRTLAEFDNYRKRTVKEKSESYSNGVTAAVSALLSVIDNFERAAQAETADEKYRDGIVMIYGQFMNILEGLGVKEINALGEPFDPELHNAVKCEPDGENKVTEVLQKGYILGDKVVRHSVVAVG